MELNNTIAKPLYKQLEDQLKEEIDTGKRKAGSRLPTENELSTTYNVSRVTVRKALAGLSELGYLDRKSGKGTFVAEKRIQRNISKGVTGFSEMCRTMGAVPGAKTIKIAIEDPTEKDMELMHITPDKKILVLERIRYADEKPVLLEINRFPESFSFLFGENLNDTSLYDVLQNHNIIFDHSDKTLDIVLPPHRNQKFWGFQKVIHFFESRVQSIILIAHLFKDVSNYVSAINLNSQFKNSGHIYICARSFILFHGIPDKFRENCTILLSPHFKKRFHFLRHASLSPREKKFRRKIRIQNITGLHLIRQLVHRSRKNGDSKPFFRQSHRRSGVFTLTVNVTQKPLFFERGQQITAVAVGQDQFLL